MSTHVVHVIHSLSRGGDARSVLATAAATDARCTVVSLTPADPQMRSQAAAAGLEVLEGVRGARLGQLLEAADIVHVHFWNSPELLEVLRGELPPMRLAVWVCVAGDSAPQVVTRQVVDIADAIVVSSPHTAELPVFDEPPRVIPSAADLTRVASVVPAAHDAFTVGYVGTVDFTKMHPDFVELSARVDLPAVRFVVCGSGDGFDAIAEQARRLGVRERFDLRGYVEDVGSVLAEFDVFGYPLAPGNYSAADLALQEAMAVGVPPVVLPYGGTHRLVRDGWNGFVVRDEADYPRAIERLYAAAGERARLGRNARLTARAWGADRAAREWSEIYDRLLSAPKRSRAWHRVGAEPLTGAVAFVESLGGAAPEFEASLTARDDDTAAEAERVIASSPPVVTSAGGGGILHYRRAYPRDGYLRLWTGLVLEAAGRYVMAAAEFKHAQELGCDGPRVRQYLARAVEALARQTEHHAVVPIDATRVP
jgi:glycosyltransferase involved in cell wall biosynthesis